MDVNNGNGLCEGVGVFGGGGKGVKIGTILIV